MNLNDAITNFQFSPRVLMGSCAGLGLLLIFASVWLEYVTSEFVVTNKRILMREGFFYRHSTELRMNTISQINVEQSLLGQMLDYGIVSLNAFGAFDSFTLIAHPMKFQKYANEQVDRLSK